MKLFEQLHDWAELVKMKSWQEWHNIIGEYINGTSFNIDLVNYCCCACPSCAVGSIATPRKGIMPFDLFVKILNKAQRECRKIRHCQLYAYSDPCLHPELDLFVAECSRRGIPTWLSTMLQTTKCDWPKLIEARPTELRISYPGLKKMAYYQKNAKPEVFLRNIEKVCALPRYKETTWTLIWHSYNDNADEEFDARELAKKYKLKFVRLPAISMILEKFVDGGYTDADRELMSHLWETPEEATSHMKRTTSCDLWKQITIDAQGNVFLCQLVFEERFKIAPFLTTPMADIKRAIKTHPFCKKCMDKGGNVAQNCFAEMATSKDPIGEADKKRRLR